MATKRPNVRKDSKPTRSGWVDINIHKPFNALGVGLLGFLSFLIAYPLMLLLVNVTGALLGCLDEAYSFGCGVIGMLLVPPIYILAMGLLLRALHVRRAFWIVIASSVALVVAYLLTASWIDTTVTSDNTFAYYLGFAVLQGLFFALIYVFLA
jgi:hypothetical protein